MLWLYSRRKFNTDIDVQKQIDVILPIKGFCKNWKDSQALDNFPETVQNYIHAINMYDSDYIMSCSTPTPSVGNTLKKIYLGQTFWYEFKSK